MKTFLKSALLGACAAVAAIGVISAAESERPDWAYAIPVGPAPARAPEDGKLFSLQGAARQYTSSEIRGVDAKDANILKQPADWYPNEHPAMPKIVAEGDIIIHQGVAGKGGGWLEGPGVMRWARE